MHCAGTALGDPAAILGSSEPDLLAQDPKQWGIALDIEPMRGPVDLDGDHDVIPMRPMFLPRGRLAPNLTALSNREFSMATRAGLGLAPHDRSRCRKTGVPEPACVADVDGRFAL